MTYFPKFKIIIFRIFPHCNACICPHCHTVYRLLPGERVQVLFQDAQERCSAEDLEVGDGCDGGCKGSPEFCGYIDDQ